MRNPLVDAPTQALRHPDATAPDTEFPDAATRHEPPDAPRSGKKLSRVHPARDALTLAAPRLSPPRRRSTPDAVPLRVRSPLAPCALRPCRATGALGSGRNRLAASLRTGLFCATRETSFCADQGNSLTSCRGVPTDRRGKKSAGTLSASRRGGRRPKPVDNTRGFPPFAPSLRSVGASPEPRVHLPSDLARKTHEMSAESSTSPSASPSRDSRTRTARQHLHAAPTLGHNGSRAAHRQKIFLRLNSKTRRPPKRETGTSPRRKYLTCPAS